MNLGPRLSVWQRAAKIAKERFDEFYTPHGYEIRHLWILMIVRDGCVVQGAVADRLGINRNVMVSLVDEMEHRGVILRRRNPPNRKEVHLTITKKGRDVLEWVDKVYDSATLHAYHPLTESEVAKVTELMQRIVTWADENGKGTT